jgi:hypothetical protein
MMSSAVNVRTSAISSLVDVVDVIDVIDVIVVDLAIYKLLRDEKNVYKNKRLIK